MDRLISSSKLAVLGAALIGIFFLLPIQHVYAKAGCCSGHGGVASCDIKTGQQICKDGTQASSSACACKQEKAVTRGCCSGHGGVASCDSTTGYQVCKDGTKSPSCPCPKK